jgi:hypothetical protein
VTVKGYVPSGVVPLVVVMFMVVEPDPPVMVFVPKLAFTPAGNPVALNVTSSENPPEPEMLTVEDALEPDVTVWLEGDAEIEKSGVGGVPTTRVRLIVFDRLPLVAVRASPYDPVVVFRFVLIVRIELPGLVPVMEMGLMLKLELVRRGSPLRLRLTLPVKLPDGVTVIVSVLLELTGTVMVAEAALSEKSGFAVPLTVRSTVVVWTRLPLVPVMVSV